jgi:hypothetical protein
MAEAVSKVRSNIHPHSLASSLLDEARGCIPQFDMCQYELDMKNAYSSMRIVTVGRSDLK